MKVLIVGLGSIARKHITALKALGEVEVFALRSSDDSPKHEEISDIFSYEDIEKINFDFFVISNPTSKHAETIEKLLAHKKPMFIEKPLFHAIGTQYDKLLQEIKKAGVKTYIACNLRFLDSIQKIKEILPGERINEVNVYCGSFLPSWRPSADFRTVYSSNKDLGGGVHLDMIHELDYLYWLFGEPENVTSSFKSKSSLSIDAVDYANYLWEYDNFSVNIVLNYYRKDPKRTLEIVTEENTLLVDVLNNRILKNNEEIFRSDQIMIDTYTSQMKYFSDNILRENGENFNDVEEAYKILNLCLKD